MALANFDKEMKLKVWSMYSSYALATFWSLGDEAFARWTHVSAVRGAEALVGRQTIRSGRNGLCFLLRANVRPRGTKVFVSWTMFTMAPGANNFFFHPANEDPVREAVGDFCRWNDVSAAGVKAFHHFHDARLVFRCEDDALVAEFVALIARTILWLRGSKFIMVC